MRCSKIRWSFKGCKSLFLNKSNQGVLRSHSYYIEIFVYLYIKWMHNKEDRFTKLCQMLICISVLSQSKGLHHLSYAKVPFHGVWIEVCSLGQTRDFPHFKSDNINEYVLLVIAEILTTQQYFFQLLWLRSWYMQRLPKLKKKNSHLSTSRDMSIVIGNDSHPHKGGASWLVY